MVAIDMGLHTRTHPHTYTLDYTLHCKNGRPYILSDLPTLHVFECYVAL